MRRTAAVALLWTCLAAAGSAAAGTPRPVPIDSAVPVRGAFNAASAKTRLLVLLSPT